MFSTAIHRDIGMLTNFVHHGTNSNSGNHGDHREPVLKSNTRREVPLVTGQQGETDPIWRAHSPSERVLAAEIALLPNHVVRIVLFTNGKRLIDSYVSKEEADH